MTSMLLATAEAEQDLMGHREAIEMHRRTASRISLALAVEDEALVKDWYSRSPNIGVLFS